MEYEIVAGGPSDVEELKPLWLQMLAHHRGLVAAEFPVHADDQSWERARHDYLDWMANNGAILRLARTLDSSELLGYAVCRLPAGGPTFDLGEARGEVDSLVVHEWARGHGIGTALLETVRVGLAELGIAYWSIGVLAQNTKAVSLYQRVGFRPWTQELLGITGES